MLVTAEVDHGSLPADALVTRATAQEGLCELFDVELLVASRSGDLDLRAFLWTTMVVRLALDDAPETDPRFFHGVVEEAELVRSGDLWFTYRFRLRPLLHGLAYRVRTRVFQDLDVVGIVKKVLRDAGVPDESVVWGTGATYAPRLFCLQYKESELAFVLRLLEDEGIVYWFEHTAAGHVLHLTDDPDFAPAMEGNDTLAFVKRMLGDPEVVTDLELTLRLAHDKHITRDWNWENPNDVVEGQQALPSAAGFTRYEYPGNFVESIDGGRKAAIRLHESVLRSQALQGRSMCRRVRPGVVLFVSGARPDYLDRGYLVTSAVHRYVQPEAERDTGNVYEVRFEAIPDDATFAPPRRTPRPRVLGKELAVVTGPPGEEIHVDSFGRVKVHFYFDRESPVDDTASCWVRVQQLNTSGSMILPRVGWEVDVGFLGGDPDRPVVLQKLFNQETMPPQGLPGAKTFTSLESTTSPGGGNTNSIILGDGKGSMVFKVHASKKLRAVAGNNMTRKVKVDRKEEVIKTHNTEVGGDESVSIGADQSTSVTGSCALGTTGSKSITVSGSDDYGTTKNYTFKNDGARTHTIGAVHNVLANKVNEAFNSSLDRSVGAAFCINAVKAIVDSVGSSKTETVTAAKVIKCKAYAENIGAAKALTSGVVTEKTGKDVQYSALGALAITAAGGITETCGDDYTFSAKTIRITAPSVKLKAGGCTITMTGPNIKMKGSSLGAAGGPTLTLKGNINYKP